MPGSSVLAGAESDVGKDVWLLVNSQSVYTVLRRMAAATEAAFAVTTPHGRE